MTRKLILAVVVVGLGRMDAGEFRTGGARIKITPPIGVPLAGYYHERGSQGVHDDLYARAVVMEKDGEQAALVSLDLIDTERFFVEAARALIEERTGMPGNHVMISATHAHTGPILIPPGIGAAAEEGGVRQATEYAAELPGLIAAAVIRAHGNLKPVRVMSAVGHEDSIAFNRRFLMQDGSIGWNPGKLNPEIVKPVGPIDPSVPVVHFQSADGDPVATYVNYAVHLDNVGGLEISADLPATVARCLADFLGTESVMVYTSGACGDLNHIDVQWARPQKGHANAARMGIILAGEVLRQWPHLNDITPDRIHVRRRVVKLPLPQVTSEEVERARELKASGNDGTRASFMNLVWAGKVLDVAARNGEPIPAEVQVIALGERLAWVSLPGEVFVQLGLDLKLDSPFETTIIAELANGGIGYIPNHRAYPQGNYEVVSARCAEGSGEMLVQAALSMLREIYAFEVRR